MERMMSSPAVMSIHSCRVIFVILHKTEKKYRILFAEMLKKDAILKNLLLQIIKENFLLLASCIDSLDWQESKTAEDIIDRVTLGLHPGAIILCHNNGTYTAEAIDRIIPYAIEQGYQFVPVGELIYKGEYEINQQGMQKKPIAAGKTEPDDAENGR